MLESKSQNAGRTHDTGSQRLGRPERNAASHDSRRLEQDAARPRMETVHAPCVDPLARSVSFGCDDEIPVWLGLWRERVLINPNGDLRLWLSRFGTKRRWLFSHPITVFWASGHARVKLGWPAAGGGQMAEAVGRNIILLSDGTGNSAGKLFKTNVWRIYDALDLSNANEIASYDDGVGTSSVKPLAMLGGAVGWGLKRNVLSLYTFLCLNYKPGDRRDDAFGFSRDAFTIRVLTNFVLSQGLVMNWSSNDDLRRKALRLDPKISCGEDPILRTSYASAADP